jgi:hypothetical protein
MNIFYDQKLPNYLPKGVHGTSPENAFMNEYFYFYCVVKCRNRALHIHEQIKRIFSDTKTNPNPTLSRSDRGPCGKVRESRMVGVHATMWIACRMPDWLYFGNFDRVSKLIEMAGARSKCFGDFNARIEMDRNRSK